ncbi:sugar ABC transporter ATP-binding protein [Taklimakanibacter deserti]|uniref:sugar ABC transporter ATP-binding protein n=1 Tax=Taklimakanibacter deserti TaxID=2267839 RepID=UPI000E647492
MGAQQQREDHHARGDDSRRAALTAEHLTKRFPGVVAVDDVSLVIEPGEILALLGQNGAGKSTLIQIFAGLHPAGSYSGSITLAGRSYSPASIAEAEAAGVALVAQEINVAPELSVAENLFLNAEPVRWGLLDQPLRLAKAKKALRDFGLDIDPGQPMKMLDLATQQLALIARALSKQVDLLILDEPTAALTEGEAQRLFDRMRLLAERGVAIIFVSHRLAEVFAVSDRIVVMRDGRISAFYATRDATRSMVIADMVGRAVTQVERERVADRHAVFAVDDLRVYDVDRGDRERVAGISFTLAQGEILGLFGLVGSGCVEAALALYGAWPGKRGGSVAIEGAQVTIDDPTAAVGLGIGFMAQDRRDCLMPDHSVHDNTMLASLARISPYGVIDDGWARQRTGSLVAGLDIKTRSIATELRTLSGGNQQKVQVARWLAADSRILILVDPTRGVDIGARGEIKRVWAGLAAEGRAILIASTDAEELVDICDRVIVLRAGAVVGEIERSELTEERILGMAAGV